MGHAAAIGDERPPLEPQGPDVPYYRGGPGGVSTTGWLIVLASVGAGFAALVTPLPIAGNVLTGWLRALLFVGLPLLGLRIATPGGWTAIFARVDFREVKLMVAFAVLNIIITLAVGSVVKLY